MKGFKKKNWMSWLLWLVLILLLSGALGSKSVISVAIKEGGLAFESESGYTDTLKWADIAGVELRNGMEYGTLVEGADSEKEKSGLWENGEFGEYTLFADAKLKSCIVCTEKEGRIVVFNFESEKSTGSLYEAIQDKLKSTRSTAAAQSRG